MVALLDHLVDDGLASRQLDSKLCTTAGAPTVDDIATAGGCHASAKTVGLEALADLGLPGALGGHVRLLA